MKKHFLPALDSLRLFAMIAIIGYHYFEFALPGGFLGVNVFLILSGFLLTRQLNWRNEDHQLYQADIDQNYLDVNQESRAAKRADQALIQWRKIGQRLLKIWLPMLVMVVASLIFIYLFRSDLLVNIRNSALASLALVNNFQQIIAGQSYFANSLSPSIFTHLWYLSLYAQLVVIWQIAYPLLQRTIKNRGKRLLVILALALASIIAMAIIFKPGQDPSRVYYGLDTRAFSFLIGAGLALLPSQAELLLQVVNKNAEEDSQKTGSMLSSWLPSLVIIASSLALLAMVTKMTAQASFTYYGGMVLFDMVTALLIWCLVDGQGFLAQVFRFKPFVWLGQQTFAAYLFYYPIFIIFYSQTTTENNFTNNVIIQLVTLAVIAILFQGFVINRNWRVSLESKAPSVNAWVVKFRALNWSLIGKISALALAGLVIFTAPTSDQAQAWEAENAKNINYIAEKNRAGITEIKSFEDYVSQLPEDQQAYYDYISKQDAAKHLDQPISFIGDSLTVGAAPGIYTVFPQANIQAEVGMQVSYALPVVQSMAANNELAANVVFFLGSNGGFSQDQLDALLDTIGSDRQIYLVTTHVTRPWASQVNQLLTQASQNRDNVHLIDWGGYFAGQAEAGAWLREDGVHFNEEGIKQWLGMLATEVN
ncbi:hypothetical protein AWM75_00885 [Aerococcus urinaehominis]|uniref:Uncharacterized protein n=1 Tax=Aerococcus urinaehominis TaxID=128944 RepID=A0A109RG70_9LACT|nr:acyltransferase family protein [Aerococcus urinaehominis]AMB98635.1 hypothetical protein AWM75_00885 [Aerococcus urinaehominis]SDL96257.1 Peptidoglycan/LPS O-acetylase OafA/YrhL, contains acyltransferase and SGNH-hydrolase domains [Aerococcus urinaehominis]